MARRRGQPLDGVLLLDKPVGLSSNHALQRAKRTLDAAKAGHTGTLDPFATGLLVCCMGRATKISGAVPRNDLNVVVTRCRVGRGSEAQRQRHGRAERTEACCPIK